VNPLLDDLPTELPIKDALPLQQQGLNPEDKGPMPIDEDSLEGLPWEFIINKDARQEWARMDRPFRSAPVQCNTEQIAFLYTTHCIVTSVTKSVRSSFSVLLGKCCGCMLGAGKR